MGAGVLVVGLYRRRCRPAGVIVHLRQILPRHLSVLPQGGHAFERLAQGIHAFLGGVDLLHQIVIAVLLCQPDVGPIRPNRLAVGPLLRQIRRQRGCNRVFSHCLPLLPKLGLCAS